MWDGERWQDNLDWDALTGPARVTGLQHVLPSLAAEILRQLGPAHRECVYRNALGHLLHSRGFWVTVEHVVPILMEDGFCVGYAFADLVLTDCQQQKSVVELKINANASVSATARLQALKYRRQLSAVNAFVVVFSTTNDKYNVESV